MSAIASTRQESSDQSQAGRQRQERGPHTRAWGDQSPCTCTACIAAARRVGRKPHQSPLLLRRRHDRQMEQLLQSLARRLQTGRGFCLRTGGHWREVVVRKIWWQPRAAHRRRVQRRPQCLVLPSGP